MEYQDYLLNKSRIVKKKLAEIAKKSKIEWLARQMGISPGRLYQQLSLTNDKDKFPGENLLILIMEAEDFSFLDFLEGMKGRVAFELPRANCLPEINLEMGRAVQEFAEVMQVTAKAEADGRIDGLEKAQILKEGEEAIRQLAKFLEAIRNLPADDRPLKAVRP